MPCASTSAMTAPTATRAFVSHNSLRSKRTRGAHRAGRSAVHASSSDPTPRLILFGSQGSRSPLVNWWMHELGLPFSVFPPHDSKNPHPFGQIPALLDLTDISTDDTADEESVKLWESGAILAYLADRFSSLDSPKKRADTLKWIIWANVSLDPCLFIENAKGQVLDTGVRVKPLQQPPKTIQRLESVLSERSENEWLAGESFGAADVAVGSYLLYVPQFFSDVSFKRWPKICAYMKRCASRPAYAEAYGENVQQFLVAKCDEWIE